MIIFVKAVMIFVIKDQCNQLSTHKEIDVWHILWNMEYVGIFCIVLIKTEWFALFSKEEGRQLEKQLIVTILRFQSDH